MDNKKFRPKKKLLQYDLETFLYWRFQTSSSNNPKRLTAKDQKKHSSTQFPRGLYGADTWSLWVNKRGSRILTSFDKKGQKPYDNLSSNPSSTISSQQSLEGDLAFNQSSVAPYSYKKRGGIAGQDSKKKGVRFRTSFFPEKKNFMQFWTLPLIGASFLSFLTFENNGDSMFMSKNFQKREIFKNSMFPKELPILLNQELKINSRSSKDVYLSDLPFVLSQAKKENSKNKSKEKEIQNLCWFYLHLSQEKLLGDIELQKEKNIYLNSLYLQNSYLHWNYYPLYNPGLLWSASVENSEGQFLQKLNPGLFLEDVDKTKEKRKIEKREIGNIFWYGEEKPDDFKGKGLESWRKNPTLSYLKSTEFFDNWILKVLNSQKMDLEFDKISEDVISSFENVWQTKNIRNEKNQKSEQKSQKVEFLNKFVERLNQSKTTWMQIYQQFKNSNKMKMAHGSEETILQTFLQSFEQQYKGSLLKLTFQKKGVGRRQQQFQKNRYLETKQGKQRVKTYLKRNLIESVFQKEFQTKTLQRFLFQQENSFERLHHTKNLKSKFKQNVYELFLLQDLKLSNQELFLGRHLKNMNSKGTELKIKSKDLSLLDGATKESFVIEESLYQNCKEVLGTRKHQEKWVQEIRLYAQLQKIQNTLLQKFKQTKEKGNISSLFKKQHLSFSKKEEGQSAEFAMKLNHTNDGRTFFEISPETQVSLTSKSVLNQAFLKLSKSPIITTLRVSDMETRTAPYPVPLEKKRIHKPMTFNIQKSLQKIPYSDTKSNGLFSLTASERSDVMRFNKSKWRPTSLKWRMRLFGKKTQWNSFQKQKDNENWRKSEKLLRSYLSIKNGKGLQNINSGEFSLKVQNSISQKKTPNIYQILQQLKKNAIFSNGNGRLKAKESKNIWLENFKEDKICLQVNPVLKNQKWNENIQENRFQSKKIQDWLFLKKSNFQNSTISESTMLEELKLFEKKKSMEKKRRFKKLKLENRRRKKRKRFYPRPQILRFQSYLQFLAKRHRMTPQSPKSDFARKNFQNSNSLLKFSNFRTQRSLLKYLKYTDFYPSIYGQQIKDISILSGPFSNQLKFKTTSAKSFMSADISERKGASLKGTHQKEFYKISNQTLTEFERLCWKSYWLRSNLKPYILKIQKSLRRMKEIENSKTNKEGLLFFQGFDNSKKSQISKITPGYINLRENLQTLETSLVTNLDSCAMQADYERLIYERMNDEIKNVKSQLTVDGQSQARSYKTGRQKLEKSLTKPFWNGPYEFSNTYLEPNLESVTSLITPPGLKTDLAKKDFPTLRLLWLCQKSQVWTSQSNNLAQNLWSKYKIREQTKNNKTRKFFYRLSRKIRDFKDWVDISALDNSKSVSEKNSQTELNQEYLPLNSLNKSETKKLQNLSTFKTKWANEKIETFGGFLYLKDYSAHLKNIRFQLQQNPLSKKERIMSSKEKTSIQKSDNPDLSGYTSLQNPIQKRQLHFWWSVQKPSFPFMLSFLFSKSDNVVFYTNASGINLPGSSESLKLKLSKAVTFPKEWVSQIFWLSACMVHIGLFFAMIRLPEIRSLVKFQILVLSKVCNAYLLGIFTLYDLLNQYARKIHRLGENFSKKSSLRMEVLHKNPMRSRHDFDRLSSFSNGFEAYKHSKLRDQEIGIDFKKNRQTFSHALQNPNLTPKWIQSTIHWRFVYKPFFDTSENPKTKTSVLSLKSMFLVSIIPMVGKTKGIQPVLASAQSYSQIESKILRGWLFFRRKSGVTNKDVKNIRLTKSLNPTMLNVYQSWSTGFIWKIILKNFDAQKFDIEKKRLFYDPVSRSLTSKNQDKKLKNILPHQDPPISYALQSNIQIQAFLSLGILWGTRFCLSICYMGLNIIYKMIFQIIDLLEGTLFLFYKFLEKPAEVLVDWIAEVFLVEWTSDISTYVPEAFDTAIWSSVTKFSRGTRFFYGVPFGFLWQRFFLESMQLFYQALLTAESDLRIRQKKGMIFWDIWGEILIQAAEKYRMNLSSLSTVKEEQELLIENLLEQKSMNEDPKKNQIKNALRTTQRNSNSVDQEFQITLTKFNPLMRFITKTPTFYQLSKVGTKADAKFYGTFLKQKPFSETFFNQLPSQIGLRPNFDFATFIRTNSSVNSFRQQDKLYPSNRPLSTTQDRSLQDNSDKIQRHSLTTSGIGKELCLSMIKPVAFNEMIEGFEENIEVIYENLSETIQEHSVKRWSTTQYLNTQGKDTDLFMDIHPPKSFAHVSFLKSYLPAQEILGSIVCEIYAGLFSSKVSKNVLIVGAAGMAKSFFIQALAGEAKLKIVLDNAHRYAFVNGGVPVGMKLLREVFDSMALHTPCLFLLEDVHVIGERRPMLISDDESSKANSLAFGAEQEEVHEKNKLVYQSSKHALSHYKKPYKGDFSLAIPTNHFCYDLFLGVSPPRKRRSNLTVSSPLQIQRLDSALDPKNGLGELSSQGTQSQSANLTKFGSPFPFTQTLVSSLQISVGQVFAPPATSPFHVLLMKEQKKFKPKKLVKDIPWSGFSYDQWMLLSKSQYSVRTKVALLAETAMKNFSVKLDMITDLLVIIDSVRSNRGFVVFATTHLPALLDPALRRPGRLDETISLPLLPNIETRFEIFRTRVLAHDESMDLFDWSTYSGQLKYNENEIAKFIEQNILTLFNSKHLRKFASGVNLFHPKLTSFYPVQSFPDYPIFSLSQAFQSSLSLQSLWIGPHQFKKMVSEMCLPGLGNKKNRLDSLDLNQELKTSLSAFDTGEGRANLDQPVRSRSQKRALEAGILALKKNSMALSYGQTGQFLTEALCLKDQNAYNSKFVGNVGLSEFSQVDNQKFLFQSLYGSNYEMKQTLFKLLASKITEFFVFQSYCPALTSHGVSLKLLKFEKANGGFSLNSSLGLERLNIGPLEHLTLWKDRQSKLCFNNLQQSCKDWQAVTSFLDALFQKRYLYNKNSIVSKMLFFEDNVSLAGPPSPPNSSILNPARKFENYQKTLRDFIQKPGLTIHQKLQMHQKQRFLKLLYNIPVSQNFQSYVINPSSESNSSGLISTTREHIEEGSQTFNTSAKELGYLDLVTSRPSSTYVFYKNRLFHRQRFSFLNQWWNGQLAEHTAETTYLSHIDWRSIFVPALGDVFLDFPDAEQYYNPRNRRWFVQSKTWSYWLNFEVDMKQQISQHFLVECFTQTSKLLHCNRELMDYLAYRFLRNHQLHELDLLQILVRFYKKNHIEL